MGTIAPRLDMRSSKQTHERLIRLTEHISGCLSALSSEFLHEICLKNAAGLDKIIARCQQLKLHLKADDINKVIESLYKQIQLPKDILGTIQYYLLDKRMNSIANVLNSAAAKLEVHLSPTEALKSTLQVIHHLSIFTNTTPEDQFLRSIIIMLLDFQTKEHHAKKKSADDAAKWLRTLLALSEKSDLTKLIDLMADRLHLSAQMIPGEVRHMDAAELFLLFEDAAIKADLMITHDSNKKLIQSIHAIMLTTLVCKKIPTAFFDVISSHQKANDSILQEVKTCYKGTLVLEQFFEHHSFEPYFREHPSQLRMNQHTFFSSLLTGLTKMMIHQDGLDGNAQLFSQFLAQCSHQKQQLNDHEWKQWVKKNFANHPVANNLHLMLFNTLEHETQTSHHRLGSLVFIANKFVTLGFSPRSASVAKTGIFQPLIAPHVPQTDIKNIKALKLFTASLKPEQRQQLISELLLSIVIRQRTILEKKPHTSLKSPKLSLKQISDTNHPIRIFHTLKPKPRVIRKHPSYPGVFFSDTSKVKKLSEIKRNSKLEYGLPLSWR